MKHLCLPTFLIFHLTGTLAAEDKNAFDRLFIPNPDTLAEECRNHLIRMSVDNWQRRGDEINPFASSDEINREMTQVSRLEDKGCDSRYIWNFFACTALDDPLQDHIVPRGISASNDFEMRLVIEECLLNLEQPEVGHFE